MLLKMKIKRSKEPDFRRLRAYAFDPSLSLQIDTVEINRITYAIKWEQLEAPGPKGEYVEVIDYDPTVDKYYTPVDLNETHILADSGLTPSVSNPQFHQQMVYAVTMITIQNFEKALGRKVLWSSRLLEDGKEYDRYVQRLRIYPHALRDANAYYSPYRKALLFGYFTSTPANKVLHMPNSLVFTCLSHDIIAHEVTHAILDGIHRNYNNPTNPDVLAFHEAFADIVALFQHFTYPEVLKFEIAKTRGDLKSQNLLGKLAQELGSAIGGYGSLRDAIGEIKDGEWMPKKPDPEAYQRVTSPHERGSILVAAVFDAFLTIYKSRVADLLRIASNGTGVLQQGEIHPDLVSRLAKEAAKSAKHILNMCIRALDYCPPVDLTFGDYLRAIITADIDLLKNDGEDYRLAFIDAFRKRGIYPQDIKTLSVESLQFLPLDMSLEQNNSIISNYVEDNDFDSGSKVLLGIILEFLADYAQDVQYEKDREKIYDITRTYISGGKINAKGIQGLHKRIQVKFGESYSFSKMTGLVFLRNPRRFGIKEKNGFASFQIQNLRVVSRGGPDGKQLNQVVFSILQNSYCEYDAASGSMQPIINRPFTSDDFIFSGGCTLIFDIESKKLKYVISKPILDTALLEDTTLDSRYKYQVDKEKAFAQHHYQEVDIALHMGENKKFFGKKAADFQFTEPFAVLHQH